MTADRIDGEDAAARASWPAPYRRGPGAGGDAAPPPAPRRMLRPSPGQPGGPDGRQAREHRARPGSWTGLAGDWTQRGAPELPEPAQATLPLPAIDLADFEASAAVGRAADVPDVTPADQAGLAGVARGGVLNLAGALIAAVCMLTATVVVTNYFSKPVAGAFFTAMSLFLIVEAIANLGAFNGAIYFIARLRALHAERRIPAILRATVIPVTVSSLTAAAALIAFAEPAARILLGGRVQHVSPASVAAAVRAMAAALPFAALADTMLGASRGYRAMRPTVLVDRFGRSVLQLAGVGTAALLSSAALLAPLWALPYLPASVAAWLWFRRVKRRHSDRPAPVAPPAQRDGLPGGAAPPRACTGLPGARPRTSPVDNRHGKPNARGFWLFTAPRSLASIAQIVIQRLDIVLVAYFLGLPQAAVYTAATRFLVAGQLGNAAISMAAQPQLTHLFALRDRRGANAVYQVTTGWLILLTWPLYLLAIFFGPAILGIFGHAYRVGSTVMVILAVAMLVATACGQVDVVLITTGRSSWSLVNGLLAMTVNIGLDLVLIPRLGITGAAIGWAAAIALTNLTPLVQVALAEKVHPFGRGTVAACLLCTLSFAAVPVTLHQLLADRIAGSSAAVMIWVPVAAGCLAMAAGLWLMRRVLQLSVMPGVADLRRRSASRHGGRHHMP